MDPVRLTDIVDMGNARMIEGGRRSRFRTVDPRYPFERFLKRLRISSHGSARSAIGVAGLPLNFAMEVEAEVELTGP